jgi:acetylornithine deacetylase/succinyl-diaminopimelate desuccinylase-like protein
VDSTLVGRALAEVSRDRVVEIARALCSTPQVEGREGPRAEAAAAFLEHPRIDLVVDPVLPGRPNVIARVRGRGTGPAVLLNGHLDASFAPGWSRDPHTPWIDGNRFHGQGVSDMLGGLASMIAAVSVAARLPPLPGDLVLLANMYHDSNGLGTKYALAGSGDWPPYGINGEPTSLTLMTAHAGCIKFELTFAGRTAHVSRKEHGADAMAAAADVYQALRALRFTHAAHPRLPGLPKCVVGVLQAGAIPGNVADSAVLRGDVRIVPGMSWETVRADLQAVLDRALPAGVRGRIGCLVRQRPFLGPTGGPLVEAMAAAHRLVRKEELRVDADPGAQAFVTDAVDMAAAGIESVVYGPAEWHHAPDAFVDIDEMADAARVYLAAALHLMGR